MKDKLRLLFLPYLFSLIGLLIGYTFLHWLIFIKLELFELKEIVINFGIPAALAIIAGILILRPKLKLLRLEVKRGSWKDFYTFIAVFGIGIPLVIAQMYIVTATGTLTSLNSISDISHKKPTKYYSLKNYFIDKQYFVAHTIFEVGGRHNEDFNMSIYIATPILNSPTDTIYGQQPVWLGTKYKKTISNRYSDDRKEEEYRRFAEKSEADFINKDLSQFTYLDKITASDDKDGYTEAIHKNTAFSDNSVILIPINEPFAARNGQKLNAILIAGSIGIIVWLLMISIPKIKESELERIKAGKPDVKRQKEIREFIDFAKPKEGFFITPILAYINISIYLLMVILGMGFLSFSGEDLVTMGANYGPLTKEGEWWRLLTSTFLHGGIVHIIVNVSTLIFVGAFLEPLLGRITYLFVYFLTGILASITSLYWHDATISVGASGAIFGLYGIFLALMLAKIYPAAFSKAFLGSTLVFICINLGMGLVGGGGIDNAAHIGGLVSGFITGLVLTPILRKKQIAFEEQISPEKDERIP